MAYELSMQNEPDYLFASITGKRSPYALFNAAKDIVIKCDEHEYSKVLVDVRDLAGKLEIFDAFKVISEDLDEIRNKGRLKVSIIDREENKSRFRFIENVAVTNKYRIRIFSDVDQALQWLIH